MAAAAATATAVFPALVSPASSQSTLLVHRSHRCQARHVSSLPCPRFLVRLRFPAAAHCGLSASPFCAFSSKLLGAGRGPVGPAAASEEDGLAEELGVGGGEGLGSDSGGGGGGGGAGGDSGSGNGKEEESDPEGGEVKKMGGGMSMSQKVTLAYAALVGVGGLMGYIKSGSQKSLAAGGLSALLLYFVYTQLPARPAFASSLGLGLSASLLVVMGSRFRKSGKIFPAGVVSVVSLVMVAGYLHGILRSLHA
uniref:UPF0136 membrane protein At2g26240 n=1 Tax=Anthurium amnicola TaxID=1678845 RepID=A0A1D1XSI1_9ARAE